MTKPHLEPPARRGGRCKGGLGRTKGQRRKTKIQGFLFMAIGPGPLIRKLIGRDTIAEKLPRVFGCSQHGRSQKNFRGFPIAHSWAVAEKLPRVFDCARLGGRRKTSAGFRLLTAARSQKNFRGLLIARSWAVAEKLPQVFD